MGITRQSLRTEIDSYRPTAALDRGHAGAMIRLLDREFDPISRDSFEPGHFTASAFVLSPDRTQLLLIHHNKLQRWLQPGGHIERTDSSAYAAARREVAEETGLEGVDPLNKLPQLLDVDVHEIPAHGDEPAHLHHDLRYGFVANSETIVAGDGVSQARWVPFGEITEASAGASVLRALIALRAIASR
jgi:8-oxo-dGTP pyrophosphatase MutT (NUDIX family)